MTARKLLVDKCVAGAVVRRLRADGHDVVWIGERPADPGDEAILEEAHRDGRAIVTIDADFGTLVFHLNAPRVGVLRLKQARAAQLAERASALVEAHGSDLDEKAFVTDDGDRVRIRPA
ncbi:MAG: DUF5615 family PIN-like protein [Caulobacterales bacterium]